MNAYTLLERLRGQAVSLEVDGDTLRCRAPRGVLTADLQTELKRHKPELIAILTHPDTIVARADPADPVPLSAAQRQLWILNQLDPGDPGYHNPIAVGLTGDLDLTALAAAVSEVVRRHEALRTVFPIIDGEPQQWVRPAAPVEVPVTDLRDTPAGERDERARAITVAFARDPFDLATGPLLRTGLLRLAGDRWRWLLTVHHIVADGWSIGLLLREISQLYQGLPLAEPPIQYPDHTLWQRHRLTGPELDRQLGYWIEQLRDAPTRLDLPTDRPRPAVQRHRGDCLPATVDAGVTAGLRLVARDAGATLNMALTAALSVLLGRYSGQHDICLGTPVANRHHSDVEALIGHFVGTTVIRTRLDPAQPFTGLLAQVRRDVLDAYAHPDVPLHQLVETLAPERHPGHPPLFQVLLVLQNMPGGRLDLPGLTLAAEPTGTGAARFDLAVEVTEAPDGLRLTFEYDTDLFDAGTIERLSVHFGQLLARIAGDPSTAVGDLDLLDPLEQQRQVYDWNETAAPAGDPMVTRFEHQAAARPDRLAIVDGEDRIDYRTLDRRANRLARALIARGVRPDQVVGLHLPRSAALVVAVLGVLKAGAAYLPLDPALPAARLAVLVADAAPALVLSTATLAAAEAEDHDDRHIGMVIRPDQLAYVISTSGSTGRPKLVGLTHGGLANVHDHLLQWLGEDPSDRPASVGAAVGFDASVWEILLPLAGGGTLHLVPEATRIDPAALMDFLRTHRIGQATLAPAVLRWIGEDPAQRTAGLALRHLVVGVEPLSELDLHRLEELVDGLRVLNIYGPTETTIYSTAYPDPQPLHRRCPIGRPLTNTRIQLLDERLHPVPVGVTGEVYIAGSGLARGYLGRPDLTAERFVPDPFSPGARLYRTGDLGRYQPDGNLVFAGRRDHQVKLRGFRIELGEIEACLLDQPDVHAAVVVLDDDPAGEPRLVAGIGRIADGPRTTAQWRDLLAQQLPAYLVPAVFVERPALPATSNGKPDRAALRELARAGAPLVVNQSTPRDHLELTLYQLWKRVLLQPDIGIRDSFFDVGGSSISAIKLAHAIGETLGTRLPVRDILLHPTIEAQAARLRHGSTAPPSNLIEFRPGDGRARVVAVHPAGGTAFCYLALARALPESVGVYGIQSPGVNPGEEFVPTIEAMAEQYLGLIEPLLHGALVLTGLSYGGLVAHEMGYRIGRSDVSVVLLDTLGLEDPRDRAQIAPVDLAEFRDKLVKFNGMYPGIEDAQVEQYFRIYNHNRLTMRAYPAPVSAARLVLLQAVGGRSVGGRDEAFLTEVATFWQRRGGGGFQVERMDCDHWEMLESVEVRRVADRLLSELDTAA